jgi:dTMP kinase
VTVRGRFIVIEGIDGSGSTTQAERLADALTRDGTDVVLTCEPSTGPIGVLIRRALRRELGERPVAAPSFAWATLALLFAADRVDHLDTVVLPALAAGRTVVSDRYVFSSLAYQSVTSEDSAASLPWIRQLNREAIPADLTLILDVDDGTAAARRASRGGSAELYEVREIQRKLAELYQRGEELAPGGAVVHVRDGSPDEVAARVLEAVRATAR